MHLGGVVCTGACGRGRGSNHGEWCEWNDCATVASDACDDDDDDDDDDEDARGQTRGTRRGVGFPSSHVERCFENESRFRARRGDAHSLVVRRPFIATPCREQSKVDSWDHPTALPISSSGGSSRNSSPMPPVRHAYVEKNTPTMPSPTHPASRSLTERVKAAQLMTWAQILGLYSGIVIPLCAFLGVYSSMGKGLFVYSNLSRDGNYAIAWYLGEDVSVSPPGTHFTRPTLTDAD